MTRPLHRRFHPRSLTALLLAAVSPALLGQARPNVQGASSYQGFHLPTAGGTLSYAVTLSGSATRGLYSGSGGTAGFTTISGDLAYLSASKRHPFSMIYSGGYFANLTGGQPSSVFQNLALSQVLTRGRWTYTIADSVSYLPQTATTGLSGVPGVGDTGTAPVDVGTGTGLGILSLNESRVSNAFIGSVQRRLTPRTLLTGTGSYAITRFLDTTANSALNSDFYSGGLSLNHRLDARNNVGASYSYIHVSYPGTRPASPDTASAFGLASSISSQSVTADYSRLVNRRLSVFVSAGPQWTSIPSTSAVSGTMGTGTSINVAINAGATYTARATAFSATYARGTNTGSGVVTGSTADNLTATASRRLNRVWNGSVAVGYSHNSSLVSLANDPFTSNTFFGSGQINRALGRHLSAFGSYTAQHQSTQGFAATTVAYSGLSQTIAAGITYSPGVLGRGRK